MTATGDFLLLSSVIPEHHSGLPAPLLHSVAVPRHRATKSLYCYDIMAAHCIVRAGHQAGLVSHGCTIQLLKTITCLQAGYLEQGTTGSSLGDTAGLRSVHRCRSVVQFAYGEDGLDVTKKSFMKEFGFLARNAERFAQQVDLAGAKRSSDINGLSPLEAAAQKRNRCPRAPASSPQLRMILCVIALGPLDCPIPADLSMSATA